MLENENLNEAQNPQLNIGAVSGSDLFKKYLEKDLDFSGFLNYNIFKTLDNQNGLSEYFDLVSWYNRIENAASIQNVLLELNIDVEKNTTTADEFVRNYRSKLIRKPPSLSSFEYLGIFHEY